MNDFLTMVGAIVMAVIVIILASFIGGLVVVLLWNWVMPDIFGLQTITYMQAVGLNLLAACLFKNMNTSSKKKD